MTATAWSRVSDLDGLLVLALGGIGQGGDVAVDQVVGFGVPDGPPDVRGGQVAELAGADDAQDRRQDVLVLGDRFGGAAVQPVGEPVVGGLADGVVDVAGRVVPLSSWVCRSRSLSMTAALVWPLTLRRVRLPSPV